MTDTAGGFGLATISITVNPINDAPTITVPGTQTTNEDISKAITGVSVNDVDLAPIQVELTVTKGTVTLASVSGLTIDSGANGSATVKFTGALSDLNTALGTITYSPNTNYFGSDALVINVSDLGNVGTGNILTATKTVNLNVVSVPDAPVITSDGGTATATISVNENTKSVTTVQATDVDSTLTSLVYSIDGGADAAKFAIVSTSGVLEFKVAPDFEFPSDANLDNIYEVVVKVTDPTAQSDTQAISVKVLDVVDQLLVSLDGSGTSRSRTMSAMPMPLR